MRLVHLQPSKVGSEQLDYWNMPQVVESISAHCSTLQCSRAGFFLMTHGTWAMHRQDHTPNWMEMGGANGSSNLGRGTLDIQSNYVREFTRNLPR